MNLYYFTVADGATFTFLSLYDKQPVPNDAKLKKLAIRGYNQWLSDETVGYKTREARKERKLATIGKVNCVSRIDKQLHKF